MFPTVLQMYLQLVGEITWDDDDRVPHSILEGSHFQYSKRCVSTFVVNRMLNRMACYDNILVPAYLTFS